MRLYHGTDERSARDLLNHGQLDAAKAFALKIDGPPGFYLAFCKTDAEFFALRRGHGVVIEYEVSAAALDQLSTAGAVRRAIPIGMRSPRFNDDELMVPTDLFDLFNRLLNSGEINTVAV